jgi:hypothetical protein
MAVDVAVWLAVATRQWQWRRGSADAAVVTMAVGVAVDVAVPTRQW